jgi:hypothetical protein
LVLSVHLISVVESWLDQLNELLENGVNVGSAHQFRHIGALFLPVLPVSLVVHLLELSFSDFLDLVEVNVKSLSVEALLVALSFGVESLIWVLEAHEGVERLAFLGEELDAFDVSVLGEVLLQLLSSSGRQEVLHIQIASLLRVLVSDHFLGLFLFSFGLGESGSAVHGVGFVDLISV